MKNCPKCGQSNNDTARFCDNCGTEILEIAAVTTPLPHQAKESNMDPPRAPRRFSRYLAGFLALIVVLGGGFIVFQYLTGVATPGDISEQYMKYLKVQDYENAYSLINPELKLDKDIYIYSMKEIDNQYGKIKDYRIESENNNLLKFIPTANQQSDSLYEYIPVVIGRNERESETLVLTNVSAGEKPDWRIDLSEQIGHADIQVPPVRNIEVKVCQKTLQLDQSGRSTIAYLNKIPVPVEINAPEIVSQAFDFPGNDGSAEVTFQVSDKLQKQLEQVIDGFNKVRNQLITDSNMEYYAPYVLRDSATWIKMQELCQSMAVSDYRPQLRLKEVQYIRGYFTIDDYAQTRVLLDDTEIWEEQEVDTTASDTPATSNENTVHWTYEFEMEKDGSWKIINNYTR